MMFRGVGQTADAVQTGRSARSLLVALILVIGNVGVISAQELGCGPRKLGEFGPFDYRDTTTHEQYLKRVEKYHFGSNIEFLNAGLSPAKIGSDLDFTLRYYPNHHRALMTLVKFARKTRSAHPSGMQFGVDCWFVRAANLAPDDARVPLIYGIYLLQSDQDKRAIEELEKARALEEGGDPNLYYNLGLAYANAGRWDESVEMAQKAYALGHPLPGLRNKLRRAGKWKK